MQPAFGTVWSPICWTADASLGLTAGTQVGGGSSVFRIIAPLSRMDSRFCRIQSLGSSHQIHFNHRRQESMWVLIKVTNVKASLHVTICRSDIIGFRIVRLVWCSTLGPIWNPKSNVNWSFSITVVLLWSSKTPCTFQKWSVFRERKLEYTTWTVPLTLKTI